MLHAFVIYLAHVPAFVRLPDILQSQLKGHEKKSELTTELHRHLITNYLPDSLLCETNSDAMVLCDNIVLNS